MGGDQNLSGLTFVITGSLEHYGNRNELKEEIENRGGKVAGSVSAKTTALINNDAASNSSKNKTAKSLGVKIITEDESADSVLGSLSEALEKRKHAESAARSSSDGEPFARSMLLMID